MAASFEFDVFLSHNSKDKPRVRALAERLKQAGLRVWLDEWVIKGLPTRAPPRTPPWRSRPKPSLGHTEAQAPLFD